MSETIQPNPDAASEVASVQDRAHEVAKMANENLHLFSDLVQITPLADKAEGTSYNDITARPRHNHRGVASAGGSWNKETLSDKEGTSVARERDQSFIKGGGTNSGLSANLIRKNKDGGSTTFSANDQGEVKAVRKDNTGNVVSERSRKGSSDLEAQKIINEAAKKVKQSAEDALAA